MGSLAAVRAYSEGVSYQGDVVFLDGSTYQALRDTARAPPGDDWVPIAVRGEPGRTPPFRGTYKADATYRETDMVAFNGGTWAAKKDDPGPIPGEGWQLVASPGRRGERGEKGERGAQGTPGRDGVSIENGRFDVDEMRLILTRSDGSELRVDLLDLGEAIVRRMAS
jgi:hypothetical protein